MWDKCSSIERVLVVISSLLFLCSIFVLINFENLSQRKSVHPDDKIAEVVKTEKHVKRRMPMSFEFDSLEPGDIIGNGDSIFSGDGSQIMVKFLKGTQLVIGEQSLVVLREIDGKLDMKIKKGDVSGALAESEEIEIKTEDDSVTINGEKDAQFTVSYKPGLGLEIISFEKNLNVKYRGDEIQMKNKKAIVNNKKGIRVNQTSSLDNDGRETASNNASEDNNKLLPQMPKGVEVDDLRIKGRQLNLAAPFPKNQQIFLHTTGGQVPIFPKEQCLSEKCTLEVKINNQTALIRDFRKNTVPLLYLKIEPNVQAEVSWTFTDSKEKIESKFEILKNNEQNFSKALQNQRQVEVIN